jgi:hypothetical protein
MFDVETAPERWTVVSDEGCTSKFHTEILVICRDGLHLQVVALRSIFGAPLISTPLLFCVLHILKPSEVPRHFFVLNQNCSIVQLVFSLSSTPEFNSDSSPSANSGSTHVQAVPPAGSKTGNRVP